MTILVMSDNHGDKRIVEKILEKEKFDISLHLGDSGFPREWLAEKFTHFVCGNHAMWKPTEKEIVIEGMKILLLHGHTMGISVFGTEKKLRKLLNDLDVDMIIHGHTHIFSFGEYKNKYWLCPGSTSLSRGSEGNGYTILKIKNKKIESVEFKESKNV